MKKKINIFWFRRDLRLEDNHGLYKILEGKHKVLPIFIFDSTGKFDDRYFCADSLSTKREVHQRIQKGPMLVLIKKLKKHCFDKKNVLDFIKTNQFC